MFGISVDLIFKDWRFITRAKCKGVPRRGDFIYVNNLKKYVMVTNVIHETGFWIGKLTVVVEEVTTNLPTIDKEKKE